MKLTQVIVLKCFLVIVVFALLNKMFEYFLVLFIVVDCVLIIFK